MYYFCGSDLQFCTCNFKWNVAGWIKAGVLWSFVLTSALGVQRMFIQFGLQGLLPGEDVVTRESFISICWRLIPCAWGCRQGKGVGVSSHHLLHIPAPFSFQRPTLSEITLQTALCLGAPQIPSHDPAAAYLPPLSMHPALCRLAEPVGAAVGCGVQLHDV